MALTLRSNGVGGGLVSAAWWNDYYNLFTGAMTDQNVFIKNGLNLQIIGVDPSVAPTLNVINTSGALSIGVYKYVYTYTNYDAFESNLSPSQTATTSSGNQQIGVSVPASGYTGPTRCNIYRTKAGGSTYYLLTTITGNGGSYSDNTADTALTVPYSKDRANWGASILLTDTTDTINGKITADPTAGGRMTFAAPAFLDFQIPDGATAFTMAAGHFNFVQNAPSTSVSFIQIPSSSGFGVKSAGGVRLFEVKSSGNVTISGTQYQTTAGSISTASGQTFDTFDIGEVFECDKEYANGTVVCPGDNNKLTQCTHDNCHAAMVISYSPGLGLGVNDHANGVHYVALAGRVNVKTASDIQPRQLVVSDGRGGVRPVAYGEPSFVVGVALNNTCEEGDLKGTVGILLRSIFVILKKPQ